jgi:hypothetical protein
MNLVQFAQNHSWVVNLWRAILGPVDTQCHSEFVETVEAKLDAVFFVMSP